jgi:hypothetical protein
MFLPLQRGGGVGKCRSYKIVSPKSQLGLFYQTVQRCVKPFLGACPKSPTVLKYPQGSQKLYTGGQLWTENT